MTGVPLSGKLRYRIAAALTERVADMTQPHAGAIKTTAANAGTPFHDRRRLEARTRMIFYFANTCHAMTVTVQK